MPLTLLTEAQMEIARAYVISKAQNAGFNTTENGPFEFLITAIVNNAVPDFSTSAVTNYLNTKHTEDLQAEKTALQARIDEINTELG